MLKSKFMKSAGILSLASLLCLSGSIIPLQAVVDSSLTANVMQDDTTSTPQEPELKPVVVIDPEFNLIEGQTAQITLDEEASSANIFGLEYVSENPEIAKVVADGMEAGLITALSEGSTTINIREKGKTEVLASIQVTVSKLQGTVSFKDPIKQINRGATASLNADISESLSNLKQVWKSSNDAIISVSEDGTLTAHKLGSASISLEVGEFSASQTIEVKAALESIAFDTELLEIEVYNSVKTPGIIYLPYDTTDAKGASYSSSDLNIFTITDGMIHAKNVGEAQLNATVGGKTSSVKVRVTPSKNAQGAEVLYLNNHVIENGEMSLSTRGLEYYQEDRLALLFDEEKLLEYIHAYAEPVINVSISEALLDPETDLIESFTLSKSFFEKLEDKTVTFKLISDKGEFLSGYIFTDQIKDDFNMKYTFKEIKEDEVIYSKLLTKSFKLSFNNQDTTYPFKLILPDRLLGSSPGQMHFFYRLQDGKLVDTGQLIQSDNSNRVEFSVTSNETFITLNRVNVTTNKGLFIVLSGIALLMISVGIYKAVKTYRKQGRM